MDEIYLCSSSELKLQHYQAFFAGLNKKIIKISMDLPEVQETDVLKVVYEKLKIAMQLTPLRPIIVDDVGLEIEGLMGFPGALLKPILSLGKMELMKKLSESQFTPFSQVKAKLLCAIAISKLSQSDQSLVDSYLQKNECVYLGEMKGLLNFSKLEFLNDTDTTRCFYPLINEINNINHYSEQNISEMLDWTKAYSHRFNALKKLQELTP